MTPVLLIITAIMIIVLVIISTFFVSYYRRSELCRVYPSPWCWEDWTCRDGSKPADRIKQIYANCQPLPGTTQPNPACSCDWNWYHPTSGGPNHCLNT